MAFKPSFDLLISSRMASPMLPLMALAITLAGPPPVAPEEPVPVAVMPLAVEGEVSPEDRAMLEQALLDALKADGIELRSSQTRCADAECVAELARTSEAVRVVDPRVIYTTNDYQITLSVLDEAGTSVQSVSLSCEICTVNDVAARFAEAAAQLRDPLREASAATAAVIVDSTPAGAVVWVDGERLGVTPLEAKVEVGTHQLRVEHPGHVTQQETFESVAGGRATFDLRLAAASDGPPRGRRAMFIAGLAMVGAGAAASIGGAVLLAIDSRPIQRTCTGDDVDMNGECRFLHDTKLPGTVALATGGAVLAAGVVLAVLGRKAARKRGSKEQARRWQLQPTAFGVRGRF
jgi:hypothetical protein